MLISRLVSFSCTCRRMLVWPVFFTSSGTVTGTQAVDVSLK